ncbi:MAG: type II toxin-antitoxin system RelB/DinJ family antitoxin [Acidaminococcaceae bacterium]|nr:type II toxin-antitoxin system RelB/DinJ family antitoxin [Acidaminococcaceae bacterium]
MSTTNINIRVNTELKKDAELLFADLGLNMSTAITMFLKSAVNHNGIPFEIKRVAREPLALGAMSTEEVDAELEKAHQDVLAGRTEPAGKVFADIRSEFGL